MPVDTWLADRAALAAPHDVAPAGAPGTPTSCNPRHRLRVVHAACRAGRAREEALDALHKLGLHSEAFRWAEEHGLTPPPDPPPDAKRVDVCYYPVCVTYDPVRKASVASRYRLRALRGEGRVQLQATILPPHAAFVLDAASLQGALVLLVFRAPRDALTQVEPGLWMGTAPTSCCVFLHGAGDLAALEEAAEEYSAGFGGLWVWAHSAKDSYASGPRRLRAAGRDALVLREDDTMRVDRADLGWHISLEEPPAPAARRGRR